MAIKSGKSYKVVEQALDGSGCGAIMASFSVAKLGGDAMARSAATDRANRLARENPGTRYFVFAAVSGVYRDASGIAVTRHYS